MRRDILDIIISKLLARCGTHQDNRYGNGNCLVYWGLSIPDYPRIYWFMKKTRAGKWLERRWVKQTHKRIAVG